MVWGLALQLPADGGAGLHPTCHDSLAAFLSASGGGDPRAAAEAARLPGVPLRAQLGLLARARLFRQALAALLALEAGASEPGPLGALPAFRAAAAHGVPSGFLSPSSRSSGGDTLGHLPHMAFISAQLPAIL